MKTPITDFRHVLDDLPPPWRSSLSKRLTDSEVVVSWLKVDLDSHLNFAPTVLAVTNLQLLILAPDQTEWQAWAYRPDLALRHHDHAGIGTLELHDSAARLAVWR